MLSGRHCKLSLTHLPAAGGGSNNVKQYLKLSRKYLWRAISNPTLKLLTTTTKKKAEKALGCRLIDQYRHKPCLLHSHSALSVHETIVSMTQGYSIKVGLVLLSVRGLAKCPFVPHSDITALWHFPHGRGMGAKCVGWICKHRLRLNCKINTRLSGR